jgi:hypothetical protein
MKELCEEKELIANVVDVETGEIINDIYEKDKIVPYKEPKEDDKIYDFNSDEKFVKLYLGVNELRKYLTQGEFAVAMSLADFICYDDCIVRKGGHHNGKILTNKELSEEMDINYDALRKTITSLTKKGVIGIHKTGCKNNPNVMVKAITVNPYIFTKGNNVNKTILGLFEHTNWKSK